MKIESCMSQDGSIMTTADNFVLLDFKNFGHVWTAKNPQTTPIDKTLIIVDWDDTIFPTTWLVRQGMYPNIPSSKDATYVELLQELSSIVIMFLEKIQTLGRVVIITNSQAGWIHDCVKRFIPSLAPILQTIPVYSARSLYNIYTDDPAIWKKMTFNREIAVTYGGDVSCQKNVISRGVGLWERLAMDKLKAENIYTKSVKLYDLPNLNTLSEQLIFLYNQLGTLIEFTGDLDLILSSEEPKDAIGSVESSWNPANTKVF